MSVQSQQLAVGSYQGTINFIGGANVAITVVLTVVAPGNLVLSPPSVNFTANQRHNPASQRITVQNSGGQPLDWSVNATTSDGASWLGVSSNSGHLEPGQQANLSITINAAKLQPNSYQGLLTFSSDSLTRQIAISLTVSQPPMAAISLKPAVVTLQTMKGTNPVPQTFAITNSGNAILNWAIKEDANGASYAPVPPTSGSLDPGGSATITISPNVAQLGAGNWDAAITIMDSDPATTVPPENVAVHIIVKDQAVIAVSSSGSMTFNNTTTLTDTSQSLVITNTGSATLNWLAKATPSSATWLYADITSGSLAPGGEIVVKVHCNSSQLAPGSYPAALVVSDSDTGTPVQSHTN